MPVSVAEKFAPREQQAGNSHMLLASVPHRSLSASVRLHPGIEEIENEDGNADAKAVTLSFSATALAFLSL